MLALTIIFCFVPIQFGTITLALMILPTIIVAQVCDFKTSLLMAVLMGVVNYIASLPFFRIRSFAYFPES